jgi:hypothetical protein
MVPRLRTAGSPILPASWASAGTDVATACELATSLCRVMARMVSVPALASIPLSAVMPERSIRVSGAASRSFIAGSSDIPPAMGWFSEPFARSATASGTEFGL